MTSLHGLSLSKRLLYFCHPTPLDFDSVHKNQAGLLSVRHDVTLTFMRCSTDKVYHCVSLQTEMLCNLHENVFRFNCGQAVMKAELHCMAESLQGRKQEAAPISVEQRQLMHYLWSFYILEQFCYWDISLWHHLYQETTLTFLFLFYSVPCLCCHLLFPTVIFYDF